LKKSNVLINLKIFPLIGLVTEEELAQGNRAKKFSKKVAPPILSLDGNVSVGFLNLFFF